MANPLAAYLESRVHSASPLQLVHLAYEGAMEAITEARRYLAEGKIYERARAIGRAQQIIRELESALDFKHGGELSKRLAALYDYMQQRLIEANFKQADQPLAEVHNLLETVGEAWKELAQADTTPIVAPETSNSPWMSSDTPVYSRAAFTL